jgi:hypothetical protein
VIAPRCSPITSLAILFLLLACAPVQIPPPDPTSEHDQAPGTVGIGRRGFWVSSQGSQIRVSYVLLSHNTDQHHAILDSNYVLTFLDANSETIATVTGSIPFALPGQYVPVTGQEVLKAKPLTMLVTVHSGTPIEADMKGLVFTVQAEYRGPSAVSGAQIVADVANPYKSDVISPELVAVWFAPTGELAGTCRTLLQILPAESTVTASLDLDSPPAEVPSAVIVFPIISKEFLDDIKQDP